MENTLGHLEDALVLSKAEDEQKVVPGAFVKYDSIKKKSSSIEISASSGFIKKTKARSIEKTIYEFLALNVWNELFNRYSKVNDLQVRAPKPHHIMEEQFRRKNSFRNNPIDSQEKYSIVMDFINGYELVKLSKLKRGTPVKIRNHKFDIPLYPACAFHLGAVNRIKELESLYHSDYDGRHVIFSPVENVSIGVIDVENSRIDMLSLVEEESKKMYEVFNKLTSSDRDKRDLESWYNQGYESIVIPENNLQLENVIEELNKKYKIKFDMANGYINNTKISIK